jgi:hypothetical protein
MAHHYTFPSCFARGSTVPSALNASSLLSRISICEKLMEPRKRPPPPRLTFQKSKGIKPIMKKSPATKPSSHGEFIASVCNCLSPSELKDWSPEGVIHYRNVCFFVLPDQSANTPRLSIVIDLGEILQKKRLDAYRHMAAYNLTKGSPEHGVLGLNLLSPDSAMHRLSLPKIDGLQPAAFAHSLYGLASHALNFRASYGKKNYRADASLSRFLSRSMTDQRTDHVR